MLIISLYCPCHQRLEPTFTNCQIAVRRVHQIAVKRRLRTLQSTIGRHLAHKLCYLLIHPEPVRSQRFIAKVEPGHQVWAAGALHEIRLQSGYQLHHVATVIPVYQLY